MPVPAPKPNPVLIKSKRPAEPTAQRRGSDTLFQHRVRLNQIDAAYLSGQSVNCADNPAATIQRYFQDTHFEILPKKGGAVEVSFIAQYHILSGRRRAGSATALF